MNTGTYTTQSAESQKALSPEQALGILKEGNNRFVNKKLITRDLNEQVQKTASGQHPFAAILGCIDSRVPHELVFDTGIGDIFSCRIAGNFANEDMLGSLEFAAKVAGVKAIVVLGHSSCGAVKGACDGVELGNLTAMLKHIKPAVDRVTGHEDRSSKNAAFVQDVVDLNIQNTIEVIRSKSPILKEMVDNGEISIVGAMYHVESGVVDFV